MNERGMVRVYVSTRDGVTEQTAVVGTKADRRFAGSARWRLKGGTPAEEREIAQSEYDRGEPGTFDAPGPERGHDGGPIPRGE